MIRRIPLALACLVSLLLVVLPAQPAAADGDTVDQSQTRMTPGNYFTVGTDALGKQHAVGQIFTAGLGGYLDRVRVYLENDPASPATGSITVGIQAVTTDGLPSGRELGSGSVGICSVAPPVACPPGTVPRGGSPAWVDVGISPVIIAAGTRYALVLRASGGGGYVRWSDYVGPSAYPAGNMVGNDGSGWWAGAYDDMTFETSVIEPVLDQSQTSSNSTTVMATTSNGSQMTQVAQTFTAGASGYLHRVRVLIAGRNVTGDVWVSVQQTQSRYDGLYPTGPQIGRGTIPAASIPAEGSPQWVDVTINDPQVVAGTRYGIILATTGGGLLWWYDYVGNVYAGGGEFLYLPSIWDNTDSDGMGPHDATLETYVLPPITRSSPPPPATITACVRGVCPAAMGGFTPWNHTDGVLSFFQFREQPNGRVYGTLSFTDSAPEGLSLRGCSTEWGFCRLTVKTFACADDHTMTVAGTYRRWGDTEASSYQLTLSGTWNGPGTFTLTTAGYTYTLSHDRIVHVSCPRPVTPPRHVTRSRR